MRSAAVGLIIIMSSIMLVSCKGKAGKTIFKTHF